MDLDSSSIEINQYKGNEDKNAGGVETKLSVKPNEKNLKRKRTSVSGKFQNKDKDTIIAECKKEIDCLFEYYKELSGKKITLDDSTCTSNNSMIACLLEENSVAFSKLVDAIYEKLNGKGVTLAYVRSTVLSVGQRMIYGVSIEDADVLEDESESCLWCWETRDVKLLPLNQRGELNARRLGRKKIHERISSLSAMLLVLLANPLDQSDYKSDLHKTFTKLGKTLSVEEIRSVVEKKKQKSNCYIAEKAAKLKEKELARTLQKENLHNGKELKLAQEHAEKEARLCEKEEAEHKKQLKRQQEEAERNRKRQEKEEAEHQKQLKKQQEEAERNRKRQEKEEAEHQKQLKKQQEEAEKSRKRREKEEAELKKQNLVKKQATILEKFLKTNKSSTKSNEEHQKTLLDEHLQNSSGKAEEINTIISLMDNALCQDDNPNFEDIKKIHNDSWCQLRQNLTSCFWGARKNPKVALVKELKLHELSASADMFGKIESPIKEAEQVEENTVNESENTCVKCIVAGSRSVRLMRKKLLQFDKSNRPAYYGTWSKKSCTIGPRHPFKQDPELDYDVDSDEEWEEEEPGESLSDCEKDNDEELVEDLKIEDEEESEDGFFVPDGYLSENEGVQVDENLGINGNEKIIASGQSEVESEEVNEQVQLQKYLRNITEQSLTKGYPLVISNLMHEKSGFCNNVDAIKGNIKMEIRCLQSLCMQSCLGDIAIDLSFHHSQENEGHEVNHSLENEALCLTPPTLKQTISDADLFEYVKIIRFNSLGINKILDALHAKFPSTSKSQLKSKVREISDYVDNRWMVKKEILAKLGLSTTPDKTKRKGIESFFLKRVQPINQNTVDKEKNPITSESCNNNNGIEASSQKEALACPKIVEESV